MRPPMRWSTPPEVRAQIGHASQLGSVRVRSATPANSGVLAQCILSPHDRARRRQRLRGVSSRAVAIAAFAAAALTIGWRFLSFVGFSNDHYVISARAFQMLLGEWPIRDFADPGMPLMYTVPRGSGGGIRFGAGS